MEKEEESSLPPGYVSLAQLQERWLQKQQEKELKEKREEERRNRGRGKMGAGSVRDGAGRRAGRFDGEIGSIGDKGKGKAIVVDAGENGVGNRDNKERKKNKRKSSKKKNSAGFKGNEKDRIEKQVEIEGEIDPKNGLEGVKEIGSVGMVEVLPDKGEITDGKREDSRGRFRKNGYNRGSFSKSGNDRRGRFNELRQGEEGLASGKKMEDEKGYDGKKMEDEKGYDGKKMEDEKRYDGKKMEDEKRYDGKKRRERGRKNGAYRAIRDDESRKKAEAVISEDFSEKCGISGGYENGEGESNKAKEDRFEGEGLSDDMVALDKKVDDEIATNGKNGGVGKEYRRYDGNRKGNFGAGGRYSRPRSFEGGVGMGNFGGERRYGNHRSFDDRLKMKQGDSGMIWVKKEEKSRADAAEVRPNGASVGPV